MSRPKYQVTETDFNHACSYISSKLQNLEFELSKEASTTDAKSDYFEAIQGGSRKARSERLNAWCEKYLSSKEWRRLIAAIRKRRERWTRHDQVKSISISEKAHKLLVKVSERDDVTFSEVLEYVLAKTANSSVRVPSKPAKRKLNPDR